MEMEEEMEGRMVEELVEEMVVMVVKVVGQGGRQGTNRAAVDVCRKWRRKKRKSERERRSGGVIYKGEELLLQECHSKLYKRDLRLLHKSCVSLGRIPRLGQMNWTRRKIRVQENKREFLRLPEKDKKAW